MLLRSEQSFYSFFISPLAARVLLEWRMRTLAVIRILRFLRGRSELQREAEADQCPEHCWRVTVELLLLPDCKVPPRHARGHVVERTFGRPSRSHWQRLGGQRAPSPGAPRTRACSDGGVKKGRRPHRTPDR